MDALLFQHSIFPHIFTNPRAFGSPQIVGNRQQWLNSTFWAVRVSGIGADNVFDDSPLRVNENGSLLGGLEESNSVPFKRVDAEITQETNDFFVSDAEGDPDRPSPGFSSIQQALNSLRQGKSHIRLNCDLWVTDSETAALETGGKLRTTNPPRPHNAFVIVVDDESGDIEGNLVMAASLTSPKAIAFLIKHGSGIVSVGMKEEDLENLQLPLMSPEREDDSSAPSFTTTVDVKSDITTGVSASDRAKTVLALSSSNSKPQDFKRPGHVFPLKYRNGGVLRRAGHTEASVDLVTLAGLRPVSVLSTVLDSNDGSVSSLISLKKLAIENDISIVSITDLIRYRRKRERLVERTAVSHLPTKWGVFQAYSYRSKLDRTEHVAIVKGEVGNGQDILVRVHSECLTGDIFGSERCDCGKQLELAVKLIEKAGRGVVVYLRGHEGRGIGLGHKLQAYNLQDKGHDTVEANLELGFAADAREYGIGAQILRDIGVRTMRLMTNNPAKFTGLKGYGLAVVGRVPVLTPITDENRRYLETKRKKMGHVYRPDIQEPLITTDLPEEPHLG